VSDSPSSQYRNKFTLFLISVLCRQMGYKSWSWLYSESGHGKGAPDGVGAAVKRQADAYVARGRSIKKASDIVDILSSAESKIGILKEVHRHSSIMTHQE
jgi:hypothetical protein